MRALQMPHAWVLRDHPVCLNYRDCNPSAPVVRVLAQGQPPGAASVAAQLTGDAVSGPLWQLRRAQRVGLVVRDA